MPIGLDGLASNLPTTELIASLMRLESIPQILLKNKVTSTTTTVTALQGLNTKIAALTTLATNAGKAGALDFYTVTSSSPKVTATATSGAAAGQLDVVVDKLAQSQSGVTAPMTEWGAPPVLTIVAKDGTTKEITPASGSLDDVVKAVNAAGAGVTATKVAAGVDGAGVAQYRLQFTGKGTGADSSFAVHRGIAAQVAPGNNVLTQAGAANIRSAQDASVTLWKGTAAEQIITSKTNTFADLLPGVAVTVTGVSTDPVSITVARDTTKAGAAVATLVSALNDVFAYIATRSTVTASTAADGSAIMSGGVFTGDGTVREVSQKVLSAASAPVNGRSPSEYGISITKSGNMKFDEEKFAAAFAKDPATVQAAVGEIATRIAAAASGASDKTTGTVTAKITGQQSLIENLNDEVVEWTGRLATRKANLERLYSAFEVRMSNLTAQQSWLTSQLNSLAGAK